MAIEMTLRRTYYDRAARHEYRAGEVITVADEREAERLERRHRATRSAATANPTDIAPQPKAETKAASADATDDEITRLRAEYTDRFGKRPYMGWSPEQLRERMALEAEPTEEDSSKTGRYSRRDLRAEE